MQNFKIVLVSVLKNHVYVVRIKVICILSVCKTDIAKLCSVCNKYGHTSDNCRGGSFSSRSRGGGQSRTDYGTGSRGGVAFSYQPMSSNTTRYEPTVSPPCCCQHTNWRNVSGGCCYLPQGLSQSTRVLLTSLILVTLTSHLEPLCVQ